LRQVQSAKNGQSRPGTLRLSDCSIDADTLLALFSDRPIHRKGTIPMHFSAHSALRKLLPANPFAKPTSGRTQFDSKGDATKA
jgi:hypothetical protein